MELIENCKRAIAENRCLGCVGLAEKDWIPPKKCPYLPSAEESIKQINLNLRNGEKMKYRSELDERQRGKQRPRYSKRLGRMYTPTKTSNFEEKVRWAFKSKYNIDTGINMNPFKAKIIIQSKPAESLGRKAKEELIRNTWDLRKPDIDNVTKIILDALNGLAYKDDNQVTALLLFKQYGTADKVVVEVEEI